MKEEIINIKYAIHWAKVGVINSLILSDSEIKLTIRTIQNENLPYATPEEALNFANIKIISNNLSLLYIIYIPLTTVEIYDKLLLKAVKRNNKIIEIDYEQILKNHNKIFGISKDCRTINSLSICNQNNVVDISSSECLPNLLNSRPSKCRQTNSQHIPVVNEIAEGIVLLNQYVGDIGVNNETQSLNGTYLLKFTNVSLSIGDKKFVAKERSTIQALPAILQPTPIENEYKEILSIQMMKDININNTKTIELLKFESDIQKYTGIGFGTICIFIIIFIIVIKYRKGTTLKIINTTKNELPDKLESQDVKENKVSNDIQTSVSQMFELPRQPIQPRKKFYETPFF